MDEKAITAGRKKSKGIAAIFLEHLDLRKSYEEDIDDY